MDFYAETLENQSETIIQQKGISAFGLTLQGASHVRHDPPVPCQDYHNMRWLETEKLLIAAIADGVGSCALSHFGSRRAVNSALDSAQKGLEALAQGSPLKLNSEEAGFRAAMKEIMVEAFRAGRSAVENLADGGEPPQPVFSFQSTLTLAIYDGDYLFHAHVGDDGIVAQQPDGTVEMATKRVKGEEANSVFPLQSGEQFWQFGVVPHVAGFVMATDGVLDSFVAPGYKGGAYFNGICYSFMEKAIYTQAERMPGAPKRALEEYRKFMQSESYLQQVNDDLTLVAVVSPKAIRDAVRPDFSMERWREVEETTRKAQQQGLYGKRIKSEPQPERRKPSQPPKPRPAVPSRKPEPADRHAFALMKGILVTLVVLVAFAGGITLGRTLLAPVQIRDHEELQQSYSELLDTEAALEAELEQLREQLGEKDEQILSLEEELSKLREENDGLEKALGQAQQELEAMAETKEMVTEEIVETQPEVSEGESA